MKRDILGAATGFALWSLLCVAANVIVPMVHPEAYATDASIARTGVLLFFVGWSALLSLLSGATAARLGRGVRSAWILAAVLLVVGVAVETAMWASTPAWYHLTFLAVLVPATVAGGRLGHRSAAVPTQT